MKRFRVRYAKGDELRFTGNLDMHKVWERTFRRAGIQLAYSQGFHPQPKIQQACPLPLGFTSSFEVLDFWTKEDPDLTMVRTDLSTTIQPGITILDLIEVELSSPPLQTQVRSSSYRVTLTGNTLYNDLRTKIDDFLTCENCFRERRGKPYDLRALVQDLQIDMSGETSFQVQLSALPGATGRPEELLEEFGIPLEDTLIERTNLNFEAANA